LEEQVMQLKEVYTGSVQEKNAVTNENRRLKALLRMHGIAYQNQEPLSASSGPTCNTSRPISTRSNNNINISREDWC
jgi:hypothetical protein